MNEGYIKIKKKDEDKFIGFLPKKKWNDYKYGSDSWISKRAFDKDFEGRYIPIPLVYFYSYWYAIKLIVEGKNKDHILLYKLTQ